MKRVAILVETALASGRNILAGISQYIREHDDWSVFHPTGYMGATDIAGLVDWDGDGIIARISDPAILKNLKAKNTHIVDVLGNVQKSPFPLVKCDDRKIGRMVAEHFIGNGHRHFAFLGFSSERWSFERQEAFGQSLEKEHGQVSLCHLNPRHQGPAHWHRNLDHVASWVEGLPKPCAMLVASDQFGPLAMKACERSGISIPEEISIVGVDNDQSFCELCRPQLSSIEPNHTRVGYEAARLLDALITDERTSETLLETPPLSLYTRGSSDTMAVSDPALVKAMRFIRQEACNGISVDHVAESAGVSRSVLQRRFKDQLGRTVGDIILSVKLRRARDMLAFTKISIPEIAERSGFNYQEYLNYIFKKHLSTTPVRFREEAGR
ncbi:substrate-binding domain-containing protein [Puniceicoccales bacterium CK1056]|uniref:Substrate-binding domain-containing protein n=1 Tax=Oceanipulchritudo coccoides TaxID=2706888 RepID=A0A6B2LYI6_9BACT|nr:XylR family transcriptional regulator [Oceanipulchritudo coccoides]NDV61463.1 substrate-binding domain-containing protein [Oceanipulchritudo coccoides]